MVPESSFLNPVADWCYFTCCLYLGVTICHFFSYLWIRTCFFMVFTFLFFAIPISFLDLDGCFYYFYELCLIFYVEIKIISIVWTPSISLFQTFGICVSPHIPYNPQTTPGTITSVVSCYFDGAYKRCCFLAHCMIPTGWSSKLFLYSA